MHKRLSPEVLAQKFAAIADHEYPHLSREMEDEPRFRELLWFLQSVSMEPGGIPKFVASFLDSFKGSIGTKTIREINQRGLARLSASDAWRIQEEIPPHLALRFAYSPLLAVLKEIDLQEIEAGESEFAKTAKAEIEKVNLEKINSVILKIAANDLVRFLEEFCENPAQSIAEQRPWFLEDLPNLLLRALEQRDRDGAARIAETEVTRRISDALEFALSESTLVMIEGDARFGKTESLQNWCMRRPGCVRLVTVPCSNQESDFFRAIAKSLGVEFSLRSPIAALRERIEFILERSRLMLVFDEAHYLFPQRFTRATPPSRLNWVRSAIVDHELPCAFVATPQTFHHAAGEFVRKTGYVLGQMTGRIARTVVLPSALADEDLEAVARVHLPEIDQELLQLVVLAASASESYLKGVENVARLARYFAKRDKTMISKTHIHEAIAEAVPMAPKPLSEAPQLQANRTLKGSLRSLSAGVPRNRRKSTVLLEKL